MRSSSVGTLPVSVVRILYLPVVKSRGRGTRNVADGPSPRPLAAWHSTHCFSYTALPRGSWARPAGTLRIAALTIANIRTRSRICRVSLCPSWSGLKAGPYVRHMKAGPYVRHMKAGPYVRHMKAGPYVRHMKAGPYVRHTKAGLYV